jgi:glycosyltransferase involved in cell wall biosynthesis
VYTGEPYVARVVRSVVVQTDPAFELVVVDDGSLDRSSEVVRELLAGDDRARLLRNPQPRLARSLNRAVEAASGALIMRVDADDWCHPSRLEHQRDRMRRRPDLEGSELPGRGLRPVAADGRPRRRRLRPRPQRRLPASAGTGGRPGRS